MGYYYREKIITILTLLLVRSGSFNMHFRLLGLYINFTKIFEVKRVMKCKYCGKTLDRDTGNVSPGHADALVILGVQPLGKGIPLFA